MVDPGTSLVIQWLRLALPWWGTWVQSLAEELGSCMPCSMAQKIFLNKINSRFCFWVICSINFYVLLCKSLYLYNMSYYQLEHTYDFILIWYSWLFLFNIWKILTLLQKILMCRVAAHSPAPSPRQPLSVILDQLLCIGILFRWSHILQHVPVCAKLLWLNIRILKFIFVVVCITTSLCFTDNLNYNAGTYHSFDGHLPAFQFSTIKSQAAIHILNTSFIINLILFYLGEYLEVELLCHKIRVCLTFTFNSFIEI